MLTRIMIDRGAHTAFMLFILLGFNIHLALCNKGSPGLALPQRVELPIGSDLNISCTIDTEYFSQIEQTCNASQLYFKMSTHQGSRETIYKAKPYIWYINDTSILFTAHNLSEQDATYVCMCDMHGIDQSKVFVGSPPSKVQDFECTSYNWDYMFCNFTTPKNSIITKYNVSFETQKNSIYRYYVDCNFDGAPIVNCNITNEKYRKFNEYFYFRLEMSNALGQEIQYVEVNNVERMLLAQPGEQLKLLNTTKDSICITWIMPRRSNFNGGVLWSVLVTPENFSTIMRPMWRNNSSTVHDTLCLTELPYAGYKYLLELRVRNNKTKSRFSQPLNYYFRTAPERPDRPPRVTNGSFYVYSSESQLTVYWEQLEKHEMNGDNFTYVISEFRVNGKLNDTSRIKMDMNSATIENWNKTVKHELLIRSSNNVNTSVEASRLVIPAITSEDTRQRVPKKIRSVYHSSNASYTISWKEPNNSSELINYTVFWCNSKPALQSKCNGTIHFEHVPRDRVQFTTRSAQPTSLNMAVSANYVDRNTGMHWMSCSRDVSDDLAKMEPSIEEVTNSSLAVKWSTERVCPAILSGYNLTYCQRSAGKPDNCTTKVLDSNAVDFTIHNLEPYTYYSVKMFMYSSSRASKYSDELINRTGEAAPTQPRQLQYSRLSNTSVILSWKPPLKANGVVRAYEGSFRHHNKTEYFKLPAYTDELVDNEKLVIYELGNLTAYTHYEISIRARTLYSSEPSNVIRFRTAVGVPSPPQYLSAENKLESMTLEWVAPLQPAGRLEYYEVSVRERDENNSVISQRSSYISGEQNRSCVMMTPVCTPMHAFYYQVRAVNVEQLEQQLEEHKVPHFITSWPQQCAAQPALNAAAWKQLENYSNASLYRLHKSSWTVQQVSCSPDGRNNTKALLTSVQLIVIAIVLFGTGHVAIRKYQKMSDIDLELPSGLKETLKKPMESSSLGLGLGLGGMTVGERVTNAGGIIDSRMDSPPQYSPQDLPHDFGGSGNESAKLLLANNSSSSGCGMERLDGYEEDQQAVTSLPPASYLSMSQSNYLDDDSVNNANATELIATTHAAAAAAENAAAGGYIKPTQMKNWNSNANNTPTNANSLPLSGYVPVQVLQQARANPPATAPTTALPQPQQLHLLSSSNYVQAADLHKLKAAAPTSTPPPSVAPPAANSFGYTSMEQLQRTGLMKPTVPSYVQPPANLHHQRLLQQQQSSLHPHPHHQQQQLQQTHHQQHQQQQQQQQQPNIGGYVTPQDLNAIALNRHML
ncbi:cytokine receptor [Drosophila nasuta]|uniref:cytokine receptor n=1 Tax=Drosophila nasuta TaxID=42062 RepID=UPI00295E5E46|nr:cytokine receptor [Drosophila nasuta]